MRRMTTLAPADSRRGAVAVLIAVSMVALLAVLALAVESGRSFDQQRQLQMAADSAALAAATELYRAVAPIDTPMPPGDPKTIAYQYAVDNGFTNAAPHTVTVSIPPCSGSFAGKSGFVQVEIQTKLKRAFSAVFGTSDLVIRANAVAGGTLVPTKSNILILDPKKSKALYLRGDSSSLVSNTDIFVNSSSKSAVKLDKKAQVSADGLFVRGGMDRNSKRNFDGDLTTGVQPTTDPYASLPTPSKTGALDPNHYKKSIDGHDEYTLPPGTYKDLKFDHNDVVKFLPGTFVLDGKFEARDTATLSGTGTTLYFTGGKDVKFDTKGAINLTAPSSGTYQDIALYMERTSKKKLVFQKDASIAITGTIYAPNSEVKFQHSSTILGSDIDEPEDVSDTADIDGANTTLKMSAALVARTLTIDKHSTVEFDGTGFDAQRAFLGLIE